MMPAPERPALELWGGIECTVNRVGDHYHDQLERSGHDLRLDDLDRVAELGIRTLRYPVLWERTAPEGPERAHWGWSDARLTRLRELDIEPIVGLVHHGSGPRSTSIVDPGFPQALAAYAAAVARRYPWVRRWTPINEPLTTARFSTLYGHWYPHARDDASFARAVLNQYRATQLAMRAIRDVIPDAELVQTEDLGRTYSTPALADQAAFENERRWLTFDALCGLLEPGSAMGEFLRWAGAPVEEIERLREAPVTPAILGINHYLTSERFLDERVELYPGWRVGGNGRQAYVDLDAVRVHADGIAGPEGILRECWSRYNRPLAITEAHAGCTREQQMRWLDEAWSGASRAHADGVDVRAVTVWALFGAYDWDTLVTRANGAYEPGAFDVRAPRPRRTGIARMTRALATAGSHAHPALDGPGWWRTPIRYVREPLFEDEAEDPWPRQASRPVLITGKRGTLGSAFQRVCDARQLACRAVARDELELSDARAVAELLDELQPWAVINAAGFVRVDDAECERESCRRDNVLAATTLAAACAARGVAFVSFSSDLVFGGERDRPYVESDRPRPLGEYGRSKADSEAQVRGMHPDALIVRTSAFFGPWDEHNFVIRSLRAAESGLPVLAPYDEVVSPTYVPDLAHAVLDLLIDGESGIWHVANDGGVTWEALARRALELAGMEEALALVEGVAGASLARPAPRPRYSVLGSERGAVMPPLEQALTRCIAAWAECIQQR